MAQETALCPERGTLSPPSVSTGLRLSQMPQKRRKPRQGQFERSALQTMLVGYEMRQNSFEIDVLADSKRNGRLPSVVRKEDLNSRKMVLDSLLHFVFFNQKHRANLFFTVEEVRVLRQMVRACEAHQYTEEQKAESDED